MTIYSKLLLIQKDLSQIGLAKDSRNDFQKYSYRGIDALLNTLSPLLCKHGVIIVPQITNRIEQATTTAKGAVNIHVSLAVTYQLRCAETGEFAEVHAMGEGVDSLDKATNKAMTSCYKYAMIQLFAIPLVGQDDPDSVHGANERVESPAQQSQSQSPKAAPANYPEQKFNDNYPAWRAAIEAGKLTSAAIIAKLETIGPITDVQRKSINSIEARS